MIRGLLFRILADESYKMKSIHCLSLLFKWAALSMRTSHIFSCVKNSEKAVTVCAVLCVLVGCVIACWAVLCDALVLCAMVIYCFLVCRAILWYVVMCCGLMCCGMLCCLADDSDGSVQVSA